MNEELMKLLTEYLHAAEKVVPSALQDYLQLMLMRNVYALIISLLFIAAYIWCVRWVIKNDIDGDAPIVVIIGILASVAAGVALVMIISCVSEILQIVYHPQGFLTQLLIQGVQK